MSAPVTYLRTGILLNLIGTTILLSGCLTRKNALPPDRTVGHSSSAPKDRPTTGKRLLDGYAEVLGVHADELQNPALYALIDDWMGVPHRTGGMDHRGLDCSAFVGIVMRDVYGKSVPRVSKEMAAQVKRKYERQLQEGDLVFFSFGRGSIDHVGIYLHNNKFVHVSTSKGVIISDLRDSWYYRYFTRAGTVR